MESLRDKRKASKKKINTSYIEEVQKKYLYFPIQNHYPKKLSRRDRLCISGMHIPRHKAPPTTTNPKRVACGKADQTDEHRII